MNMNRTALRQFVLGLAGRVIKWTTVDRLSSRKGWLYATPIATLPELGEQTTGQLVRLIQQFGFRSQPIVGSEIIVGAPRACGTNAVALGTDNLGCGPSDLADGECAIYSSADKMNGGVQELCRIRLRATGKLEIDAKAGLDVVVNQGTKTVVVNGDSVSQGGALKTWMDAVTAATSVPPFAGTTIGSVNGTGTRFKA